MRTTTTKKRVIRSPETRTKGYIVEHRYTGSALVCSRGNNSRNIYPFYKTYYAAILQHLQLYFSCRCNKYNSMWTCYLYLHIPV